MGGDSNVLCKHWQPVHIVDQDEENLKKGLALLKEIISLWLIEEECRLNKWKNFWAYFIRSFL